MSKNLKLPVRSWLKGKRWTFGGAVPFSVLLIFGMVGGVEAASMADTVQHTIRTNPD